VKRAFVVVTTCTVLIVAGVQPARARVISLADISITRVSFTLTGGIKVRMAYSCPNGAHPVADVGTILVVTQQRGDTPGGSSPAIDFSDELVCNGNGHTVRVRVHDASTFNTSDPIRAVVNINLTDSNGYSLYAQDANTVQPMAAPEPATTMSNANVTSVRVGDTGAVRVHFSYTCPRRYVSDSARAQLFVTQTQSPNGPQRSAMKRIAHLIVCDGTRHNVVARVRESHEGDPFIRAMLHAFVDVTAVRLSGATAALENGKTFTFKLPR